MPRTINFCRCLLGTGVFASFAVLSTINAAAQVSMPAAAPVESRGARAEPIATAIPVTVAPVVDGALDDDAWTDVPAMTDFIQREPLDGRPATERTEVRVVYDDEAIYVGVWAFDEDPGGIVHGEAIRDYQVAESDHVLLVVDTYSDEQNGFVFGTTPAGIEYDGQVANEGSGGGFFLGGGGGNNRQRFQAGLGRVAKRQHGKACG